MEAEERRKRQKKAREEFVKMLEVCTKRVRSLVFGLFSVTDELIYVLIIFLDLRSVKNFHLP